MKEDQQSLSKVLLLIILVVTSVSLILLFLHDRGDALVNNSSEPASISAIINQQPSQVKAGALPAEVADSDADSSRKVRGIVNAHSKHLRLEDEGSPTVDVSLASETDISISGWNESVMIEFGNSSESKSINIAGLVPSKTYHIYKNGLSIHETAVANANGVLDVSLLEDDYSLLVQPNPSTIVINSPTGGDCSTVGTWSSGVCTLNQDVHETIYINSSNVTLDCDGYGVKTADFPFPGFFFGIYNAGVPPGAGGPSNVNNIIKKCNIDANVAWGIAVSYSDDVVIESNTVNNAGQFGVRLFQTNNVTVENNKILEFFGQGIFSIWSNDVTIKGNTLVSSAYGPPFLHFYSSILAINTPRTYGGEISGNSITLSAPVSDNVILSGISGWLFGNLLIDHNVINIDSGIIRDRRDNIRPSQVGFGAAITMDGADDLTITNNVITTTGASGITMASGSGFDNARITISGNTISGAVMPVYVLRSRGSTVENNMISGSGSIVLAVGSGNIVRGNLIENGVNWGETYRCLIGVSEPWGHPEYPRGLFPASCDQLSGIVLMAGETGSTVSGNTVRNMLGAGVVLKETISSEVDGSGLWPFDPDLSVLITMPPTQNNVITRNIIDSNFGSGIRLLNSSDNMFSLNDIIGNANPQVMSDTRVFVDHNGFDELKGLGNYWGIDCPAGSFFVPRVQSNSADVLDRKPFGYPVAELSYTPSTSERPCEKK